MNSHHYNFIIFRTDRLGDFIIHSRPIYELKFKYPNSHITVVCSSLNEKIISNYSFIDEVIIHNKYDSLFKKFNNFFKIIKKKYYAAFILDGKKFSHLCNIFINSKNKLGLVYISQKKIFTFKFWVKSPLYIYNSIFFDKYEIFTSKKSLTKSENLCQKYINLFSEFNNTVIKTSSRYIFNSNITNEQNYRKIINSINYKKYLLIHFDEKWADIDSIDKMLIGAIENLQKKTQLNIIITGYNNKFDYYKNLKKHFPYLNCLNNSNLPIFSNINNSKVVILDNLEIFLFERFIKNSIANISCHSGFLVQVSGANNTPVIDIINEKDHIWYECWKPLNTIHHFIYKSNHEGQIEPLKIFSNVSNVLNRIGY